MTAPTSRTDALLSVSRAYLPVPLRDGSLVFASDLPGHAQVFRLEAPGGWPDRLTFTSVRTLPVAETRHGLLVRHDLDGNETWQLSLVDGAGVRGVTDDARAIHQSPVVDPAGRRVGLAYNPGGQADFRLGVLDLETATIQDWLQPSGSWRWIAWSPAGDAALVAHATSATRLETYVLRPGRQPIRVLPEAGRVAAVAWTKAGRIVALTDLGSEFLGVVELDAEQPGGPPRWIFKPDADVETFRLNPKEDRALAAVNEGPYDRLIGFDLSTGRQEDLALPGQGVVYADNVSDSSQQLAWSPSGDEAFIAWETPVQPADVLELGSALRRWTFAGGRGEAELSRPEELSFSSFDGLKVQGLLYRASEAPGPSVVYFHGGPESQLRGNFQPVFHAFNQNGIHVLAPNVRGSTGQGLTFMSLDDRARRWDSVRDGCEAARFLQASGVATRVAAMGASYGGFMTLAVLVEDPDLWSAGVDIVGIADWHSFFKNTSGWRRALRLEEYGDPLGEEAELLRVISPLGRAEKIRAPLLVIHGRNDVRVPVGEAEQIARVVPGSELLILEDEGHGITRHANRRLAYGRAVAFVVERLTVGGSA